MHTKREDELNPMGEPAAIASSSSPGAGLSRRRVALGALASLVGLGSAGCRSTTDAGRGPAPSIIAEGNAEAGGPGDGADQSSVGAAGAADAATPGGVGTVGLFSTDRELHVATRLSYGPTPELLAEVRSLGAAGWIEQQLAPASLSEPPELGAALAGLSTLGRSVAELGALLGSQQQQPLAATALETVAATMARQRWSRAQLYELMVEFWSNHFAINLFSGPLRVLKPLDDRDVVRPHVLGRFADLLAASAQSPAMLVSLDNAQSRVGAINENYGRELLELHTVGIDAGYTEADVVATANTLTGFGVKRGEGAFLYQAARHDPRPQQVMSWRTPAGADGYKHGLNLLDYLAHHRATAEHLATKLVIRFVSDTPDRALVTKLADVYQANDTEIVPVLRALCSDERFFTTATAKYRRPHELLMAALRGVDAQFSPTKLGDGGRNQRPGLLSAMRALGQVPLSWPAPDGYPDQAGAWLNPGGLLTRWNTCADLLANALAPATVDLSALIPSGTAGGAAASAGVVVAAAGRRLFGEAPDAATTATVLRALGLADTAPWPSGTQTISVAYALLLSSPRFQYR